jgi:hypothetical protein
MATTAMDGAPRAWRRRPWMASRGAPRWRREELLGEATAAAILLPLLTSSSGGAPVPSSAPRAGAPPLLRAPRPARVGATVGRDNAKGQRLAR